MNFDPFELEPDWRSSGIRLSCPARSERARGHIWQPTQAQTAATRAVIHAGYEVIFAGNGHDGTVAPYGPGSTRQVGKHIRLIVDGAEWRLYQLGMWKQTREEPSA